MSDLVTLPEGEIWLVTTIDDRDGSGSLGQRCVGWFPSLESATEIVMGNYGDIWEYVYKYAVIEPQAQGLYGCHGLKGDEIERSKWFEFVPGPPDTETHFRTVRVEPIERPKKYDLICNWGIG